MRRRAGRPDTRRRSRCSERCGGAVLRQPSVASRPTPHVRSLVRNPRQAAEESQGAIEKIFDAAIRRRRALPQRLCRPRAATMLPSNIVRLDDAHGF